MSTAWDIATVISGGVVTLAIFSFLLRENQIFRFFEHLYIGIAAGLGVILGFKNFLWPNVLVPLLGLDLELYPDGTPVRSYNYFLLLYLAPILFGLLYYFITSKKYGWLAKLVIGLQLGASGGLAFKGFFNQMLPQLSSSFKPLLVFHERSFQFWQSMENVFFLFTLVSVMYYFFFSFKVDSRAGEKLALSGRWLLMICFGAFFGSTVMARLALLVERIQFLWGDWCGALGQLFFG